MQLHPEMFSSHLPKRDISPFSQIFMQWEKDECPNSARRVRQRESGTKSTIIACVREGPYSCAGQVIYGVLAPAHNGSTGFTIPPPNHCPNHSINNIN